MYIIYIYIYSRCKIGFRVVGWTESSAQLQRAGQLLRGRHVLSY